MAGLQATPTALRSAVTGPKATPPSTAGFAAPVALQGGIVSFHIREGVVLNQRHQVRTSGFPGGCWPSFLLADFSIAEIRTTDPTTATLKLTPEKIDLSFSVPLRVDVVGPWNWISFSGVAYEFGDPQKQTVGRIVPRLKVEKMLGLFKISGSEPVRVRVEREIQNWFRDLIRGTVYATPGYNPMQSPDPLLGVTQLYTRLQQGQSASVVNTGCASGLKGTLEFATTEAFQHPPNDVTTKKPPPANVYVPAGAWVTITVAVNGTGEQIINKNLSIPYFEIESNEIYAQKDGKDAMILNRVHVSWGGQVSVRAHTPLGEVKALVDKAGPVESWIRLMVLAAQIHDAPSTERLSIKTTERDIGEIIAPRTVAGAPANLAGDELTKAFADLIRQNHAAITERLPTGLDLYPVLGVKP